MADSEDGSDDDPDANVGRWALDDPSSTFTMMGHFYRGEMDRMTTWRTRLDQTSYWAVTIVAAILTWAFSSPDNPHYILLIGMATATMFLVFETRRYRVYDVWRSRVRLLEEDLFATVFDPESEIVHGGWRTELSEDLRNPALKVSFVEALSRRLRRVYLGLLGILFAAWIVRITAFSPRETWLAASAIGDLPGWVVAGGVGLFVVGAVILAYVPLERQAMGEFHDRQAEGEWKEK